MKRSTRILTVALALLLAITLPVQALALSEKVEGRARAVQSKYGVEILMDSLADVWDYGGMFTEEESDETMLLKQLDVIESVFSRYPRSYFQTMKLKSVTIVKSMVSILDIGSDGYTVGITTKDKLNQTYIIMRSDSTGLDYHHEVSHLMDMFNLVNNYKWSSLNTPGFKYTGNFVGGEVLPPGIVSSYAIWSPSEDRAEIFSYMMDAEGYKELRALCSHDAVLRNKLIMLKAYVKQYIKSSDIEARIDELLAVKAMAPLYYATFSAKGRTGPGEQYPEVDVDATAVMGVVQQGKKYVKVLLDGAGIYFPTDSMKAANPPEQPEQPGETAEQPEAEEPMELVAHPQPTGSISFEAYTDAAKIDSILAQTRKIALRDGYVNRYVAVVESLVVNGKAQDYAYARDTLYINAAKFNVKKFTAFNKTLLKKYPDLRAAAQAA